MGSELSQLDLIDPALPDREFFEVVLQLFGGRVDLYRDFQMGLYKQVVEALDVLLCLSRESSNHFFIERCVLYEGEYYTIEIFTRLREVRDLIEWLCNELAVVPTSAIPLLLQHPVFFIEPELEVVLKNLERMIKWFKRYQLLTLSGDPRLQRFVYSFEALSQKVKMIH